ncbi:MAG: lytic transglycosylase domain-containing protein [Thermodesulfobacteriota bacterium]
MLLIIFLVCGLWLWPADPAAQPTPAGIVSGTAPAEARLPYYRLPAKLSLCGQPVPLQEPRIREAMDREFIIVVWSRAQTIMWMKRAHRYFPEVDRMLQAQRLPQDLKYVVLVESDLRPRAKSPAGALGPWQFIQPTAQRFQLKTENAVDERLHFTAATEAALRYLKTLHHLFNDWPLAIAAYNCGEGRVQKSMAAQGVRNFYHLSLPEETERYIYRILAAKIVLEDPAKYGYEIPPDELYPPLEYDEVEFVVSKDVPVRRLAEACGSYYKAVKDLNPWIRTDSLPPGAYRLKIPKGAAPRFHEAYRRGLLGGGS